VPGASEGDSWHRGEMHRDADEDLSTAPISSLAAEVQQLQSELQQEKAETEKATQHFRERIEH